MLTYSYLSFFAWVPSVFPEHKSEAGIFKSFQQSDYILTPERAEVTRFNKNFINTLQFLTFKYNRTCTAFNITLNYKVDITKVDLVAQAYKFMSNEYRLFPLRMRFNFCRAVAQNIGGMAKVPCGNFTGCSTMERGKTYKTCNWTPDQSKFPPLIPPGRYMLEFQHVIGSTEIALTRAYASVTVPFIGK